MCAVPPSARVIGAPSIEYSIDLTPDTGLPVPEFASVATRFRSNDAVAQPSPGNPPIATSGGIASTSSLLVVVADTRPAQDTARACTQFSPAGRPGIITV